MWEPIVNVFGTAFVTAGVIFVILRYFLPKYIIQGFGVATERLKEAAAEKFTAMGQASGEARLQRGFEKAVGEDVLKQGAPEIAAILDMFPQVKAWVMKDPQSRIPLAMSLASRFMPMLGQAGQSNSKSDVAERLKKAAYT